MTEKPRNLNDINIDENMDKDISISIDENLAKEIREEKKILRQQMVTKMKALPPDYRQDADAVIGQRIVSLEEFRQAATVFCFVGVNQEVDTWPIIAAGLALGKTVAVPKCIKKGIMAAYAITGKEDLSPSSFGLLEPRETSNLVLPEDIDFGIIPCVTCNTQGYRLGWGGGYYDRYLRQESFTKAVVCREALLYSAIPREPHDIPADIVVTEKAAYRCRL